MLSALVSEEEDGARRASLSLLCCFIHSAAFLLHHDRIQSVLALSLPPGSAQASGPVLSGPSPGEIEEEPMWYWLEGFLPGLWKADPQASGDTARASFSWTVGTVL